MYRFFPLEWSITFPTHDFCIAPVAVSLAQGEDGKDSYIIRKEGLRRWEVLQSLRFLSRMKERRKPPEYMPEPGEHLQPSELRKQRMKPRLQ